MAAIEISPRQYRWSHSTDSQIRPVLLKIALFDSQKKFDFYGRSIVYLEWREASVAWASRWVLRPRRMPRGCMPSSAAPLGVGYCCLRRSSHCYRKQNSSQTETKIATAKREPLCFVLELGTDTRGRQATEKKTVDSILWYYKKSVESNRLKCIVVAANNCDKKWLEIVESIVDQMKKLRILFFINVQ